MKSLTKRKYIAHWYVNVGELALSQVPNYLDSFKKVVSGGCDNPWHELEIFLEAPIFGYFIPTRLCETKLIIQEIVVRI